VKQGTLLPRSLYGALSIENYKQNSITSIVNAVNAMPM